uniref:Uncharacterized protein n=1 Tax=Arion vulgaris TaxID=1028688 RepID=A0A0B7BLI0_9EUPU
MSEERKNLNTADKTASMKKLTISQPEIKKPENKDVAQSSDSGFNIFSQTRRFGTWLTNITGEKVDISSKDINAVAPSTY